MVVLPCEYAEGFGLPIIEGYYFNKPVIASNRCAVPEIIYSSKYLFENTPESIWNTLSFVANDEIDYKHYYNERFSLYQMTEKLSALYKQVL
jgi:glycosyltransferase involved in cell wall biosynthesis